MPSFLDRLRSLRTLWRDIYLGPYRTSVVRQKVDEEDLFTLLILSEMMGVPNPASYYTLELLPVVIDNFHAWHVRMGMEKSPLDGIRCC